MSKAKSLRAVAASAMALMFVAPTITSAWAESAQEKRERKEAEIPTCPKRLGTLAVVEPETNWWTQYGLGSPEALLKVFVMRSGCFGLVDRGKGMAAIQAERALASEGDLRQGSNQGKGQIKTADYVLVPDLVSKNSNAGGLNVGGILGGFIGGPVGGLVGGINISKKTADVVLTVTDVRSSEQVALEEGHSDKSDLSWGAGGGVFGWSGFGAAGASGYADTEIGQVITLAYLDAYTKLIAQFGQLPDNASEANVQQAVTMNKPGHLYTSPSPKSKVVRTLDPGMMLYPTGNKDGVWWEVKDELGNQGWVSSLLVQLSH
jgi:hypothetical protein